MHVAADGRTDFDAFELVLRRDLALQEFRDPRLHLTQFRHDFRLAVLLQLNDLDLGFTDSAARARNLGNETATIPVQLGRLPLQGYDP